MSYRALRQPLRVKMRSGQSDCVETPETLLRHEFYLPPCSAGPLLRSGHGPMELSPLDPERLQGRWKGALFPEHGKGALRDNASKGGIETQALKLNSPLSITRHTHMNSDNNPIALDQGCGSDRAHA